MSCLLAFTKLESQRRLAGLPVSDINTIAEKRNKQVIAPGTGTTLYVWGIAIFG